MSAEAATTPWWADARHGADRSADRRPASAAHRQTAPRAARPTAAGVPTVTGHACRRSRRTTTGRGTPTRTSAACARGAPGCALLAGLASRGRRPPHRGRTPPDAGRSGARRRPAGSRRRGRRRRRRSSASTSTDRPPALLERCMSVFEPVAIGIDIGGTKLVAATVAADGRVIDRHRRDTPAHDTAAARWPPCGPRSSTSPAAATTCPVGVGIAGLVIARRRGPLRTQHRGARRAPSRPSSPTRPTAPIAVVNDASAAALGEQRAGAADGHRDVVLLTLGHRCRRRVRRRRPTRARRQRLRAPRSATSSSRRAAGRARAATTAASRPTRRAPRSGCIAPNGPSTPTARPRSATPPR